MKTTLLSLVAAIAFSFCLADRSNAQTYRANINFDFEIGNRHFHAGDYMVEVRGFDSKLFVIRGLDGLSAYMMVPSGAGRPPNYTGAELEFQRDGDIYSLRTVRASGFMASAPMPKPKASLANDHATKIVNVSLLRKN